MGKKIFTILHSKILFILSYGSCELIRPNKKISVFWVTDLKILGRVDRHISFETFFFFLKKIFYAF